MESTFCERSKFIGYSVRESRVNSVKWEGCVIMRKQLNINADFLNETYRPRYRLTLALDKYRYYS